MNLIPFRVRPVEKPDMLRVIELCEAHASFEGATYEATGKIEKLSEHFYKEYSTIVCWVVVYNDKIEGYMVLSPEFSTWEAGYYYHTDCLFLTEKCRGLGIGYAIIEQIKNYTKAQGISQIQWQIAIENKQAIAFYKKMGAKEKLKSRFTLDL